ncbi:C4-dicarboxylate ABC transporter substrate-binding protein [Paraburkholderia monticola]|uniref:C4-dicarboxylate ABC transporter substrate-binding protein n=1 Tax=Paraburkholderia monticola TaxID=1399968 RepID=A0A149PKJ9_9BURK|nr:tripartite tricarboxylate transporter substrate binding protein [Paraburkholderia monticola]KXU85560.1 C4-dicarboxylate ABC transporter substrate-binding protein [Paraburkholderia monticola]
MPTRRSFQTSLASLALLTLPAAILGGLPRCAQAAYPDGPVRIILAFPGGSGDAQLRILASVLTRYLGGPVIVQPMPGASGNIASAYVARARGDGYTLLWGVSTFFEVNPVMYADVGYRLADLKPVSLLAELPFVLVVNPSLPLHSLKDLIQYAQRNPHKLTNATAGVGSPVDLAGRELMSRANIDILHVPYKGGGEDALAVLSGFADMEFGSVSDVAANIRAGKMRPLGVTSAQRLKQLPEVPTIAEAGVPGYDFSVWNSILAPASTPQPLIDKLHAALVGSLADSQLRAGFEQLGFIPMSSTGAEVSKRIEAESRLWREMLAPVRQRAQSGS